VRACTINSCSTYSAKLDLVCGALPEAPSTPFIVTSSATQITLGWDYMGYDNGGVALSKYSIHVSVDSGSTYTQAGTTADAAIAKFYYACGSQTTFYFKVAGMNGVGGAAGEGPPSHAVGMFCAAPPTVPATPAITATATTLTVPFFTPTAGQLSLASHTGWRIYVDDMDDGDVVYHETIVYDTTLDSYTFHYGIVTGHSYRATLKLCSVIGCGVESQIGGPVTAANTPDAPATLYLQASTDSQMTLSWTFSGSNGGSPITAWRLDASSDGTNWPASGSPTALISSVNTLSHVVNCASLARSQMFLWIRVAGVNLGGVGTWSNTFAARCSAVPDQPAVPVKLSASITHITISWAHSNLHNALHMGSKVHFDDGAGGPFNAVQLPDTLQNSYTLVGVLAGQAYRFKVQTLSEVGESIESTVFTQVAAEPPDAPVLDITATTGQSITATWTLPAGASSGGSQVLKWQVSVSSDGVNYPATPIAELVSTGSTMSYLLDCNNFYGVSRNEQYFWFKVAALSSAGVGAQSAAVKTRCSAVPGTPSAPGRVTSTANSVTISYATNGLTGAHLTGFKIHSDDGNGGPFSTFSVSDATQLTYTRYGLTPGMPYKFRVQIVSEVGSSSMSPEVTYYSAGTPDPPTPYVSLSTNDAITVAWHVTGSEGGAPVTAWLVYGSVDGLTWPAANAPIYTTADGLAREQEVNCKAASKWSGQNMARRYTFLRVAGQNAAGTGTPSNSFRWRCSEKPANPVAPAKVSGTASSITVSYAPSTLNLAIHLGYKIYFDDGANGPYNEINVLQTSQTQYTASGLTAGLPYRFRIRVLSEVGESQLSNVRIISCGADPDAPSAPAHVTSANNAQLTVGWTFTGYNGGATITNWYLWASNSLLTFTQQNNPLATLLVSQMTHQLDCQSINGYDLRQNYVYIRVAAKTDAAIGPYSGVSKIFCANAPDAPTVTSEGGTESTVTISWQEGNLYAAELKGYRIYMNDGLGGDLGLTAVVEDSSVRRYTASGLTGDRDYLFQVTVVTMVTESARSALFRARSCDIPSVPAAPYRYWSDANTITMRWVAPADNGCPMTGYRIYRDDNQDYIAEGESYPGTGNAEDPVDAALVPSVLQYAQSGLTPGTIYGFRLRAYNAKGWSYSEWIYMKGAGPPSAMAPPSQDIPAGSSTSIVLTWTIPNLQGGTLVGFKVYRNNGLGTPMSQHHDLTCGMETNPAPQTCAITGLTPSDEYQIQIRAINDVGESDLSDAIILKSASVPATMPVPVNTLASFNPVSLTFAWIAPNSQGSWIWNYQGEFERTDNSETATWSAGGTTAAPAQATTKQFLIADFANYLRPKIQYKFRIAGENSQGVGAWSEWSSTTIAPRGKTVSPPIVPTLFQRSSQSTPIAGTVRLEWTDINNDNDAGGDDSTSIVYEVYGGASTLVPLARSNPALNDHSETVPSGQTWTFKVRALNSGGQGSVFTATQQFVSAGYPSAVQNLASASVTNGVVVLTWAAPSSNGGSVITKYQVSRTAQAVTAWGNVYVDDLPTGVTTATLSGEGQSQSYNYHVRAYNAVGGGASTYVFQAVLR